MVRSLASQGIVSSANAALNTALHQDGKLYLCCIAAVYSEHCSTKPANALMQYVQGTSCNRGEMYCSVAAAHQIVAALIGIENGVGTLMTISASTTLTSRQGCPGGRRSNPRVWRAAYCTA
jgi:hypothetical protein